MSVSARKVMDAVQKLESEDLKMDLMSTSMLLGGMRLGDAIMDRGYCVTDSPLTQFARHFRNACAHGDRWHFKGSEPKHPASTQSITLSKELHGTRATWNTVDPYSYLEYLAEVHAYFHSVAIHSAAESAFKIAKGRGISQTLSAVSEQFKLREIPDGYATQILQIAHMMTQGKLYIPKVKPQSGTAPYQPSN